MIGLIIVGSIHSILLDFLPFISSIRLCGTIPPPTPDNFERGFYSIILLLIGLKIPKEIAGINGSQNSNSRGMGILDRRRSFD